MIQWYQKRKTKTTFRKKSFQTYTVWKFQDFSVIHILRGIIIGKSRSSKTAVFAILRSWNFVNLVNFSLQKVQKCIEIKIQTL